MLNNYLLNRNIKYSLTYLIIFTLNVHYSKFQKIFYYHFIALVTALSYVIKSRLLIYKKFRLLQIYFVSNFLSMGFSIVLMVGLYPAGATLVLEHLLSLFLPNQLSAGEKTCSKSDPNKATLCIWFFLFSVTQT